MLLPWLRQFVPLTNQGRPCIFIADEFLVMEGEGITVTASPGTSQQKKTVTKEEIEKAHAPDLPTLLQDTLGLGFTSRGPNGSETSVNLRGFDSERIAVLVDGIPAGAPSSGDFDFSSINVDSVEQIEVVPGGSDSKYNISGGLGGVINIITVKKQEKGLSLLGNISNTSNMPGYYTKRSGAKGSPAWQDLYDTQKFGFSAGWGGRQFSLSGNLFANRAQNHFLFRDFNNRARIRRKDNNEIRDGGASLRGLWEFQDLSRLIATGNVYYGDKNFPTSGYSAAAVTQKDFSTRENIMFDMPRAFHDDFSMEASLGYMLKRLDYGNNSLHREHALSAINRWGWYPGSRVTVRLGMDYRFIIMDSTDMGFHSRHDGGVYVTGEFSPSKTFLAVPSIKAVMSGPGAARPVTTVPKLGFVWKPNDSFSLKNNYFRSFKFPDMEDLYWNDGIMFGNPDLKPEDGWGGDLGISWNIKKFLTLDSVFYAQWTKDSIHWSNTGGWKPENIGDAVFFGLDNSVRAEIPLPFRHFPLIGISINYQYLLSYLLSYGFDFESEKRIPYMPVHQAGFSITVPWNPEKSESSGQITLSGHYEGMRFTDTANMKTLDAHFLLNLVISQNAGKYLSFYGTFRNILDNSYYSMEDYPMPGLTVTLGLKMSIKGIGVKNEQVQIK
jgi:vitamin B12 transporter